MLPSTGDCSDVSLRPRALPTGGRVWMRLRSAPYPRSVTLFDFTERLSPGEHRS